MNDAKPKKSRASKVPLREPGAPLAQPEARPLRPDHPIYNLIGPAKAAQDAPPTTHHPPPTRPIAPARDFVRVPNSVVRDALPLGLFKGESKKTYDALYQRTRGAVVPRRIIRATLADVMAWAGVSHNTMKAHIKHLSRVGLLKVHYVRGDNTGAEYEVFTPEEAPPTHHPQTTHLPATSQNVAPPTTQNVVLGGGGQTTDSQTTSDDPKTSFKTNTEKPDDEAFAKFLASIKTAVKEITGRESTSADAEKWQDLAALLITELKIAAGRTTVSSVPAFLTEHLRRRLWKKDKAQLEREEKALPTPATPQIDASQCPDCGGSNYFYPEGYEKGVSKCRHKKLGNPD